MSDDSIISWMVGGAGALITAWAIRDGYACLGRFQSAAIRRATKLLPEERREDAFNEWSHDILEAWPTELMRTLMALDTFRAAFVMRLHYKQMARANKHSRRRLFGNLIALFIILTVAQSAIKQRAAKGERSFQLVFAGGVFRAGCWFTMFALRRYEKAGKLNQQNIVDAFRAAGETIDRWKRSQTPPPKDA